MPPVSVTLPVLWGDMDLFGHVNNVVYFRWMESSRVAYWAATGLQDLMAQHAMGPILASTRCDFRQQVRYPDTIESLARISGLGRTSMTFAHEIRRASSGETVAAGESVVVAFDYHSQQPTAIPPELRSHISRHEQTDFDTP